jgi:histidinol-phosphate aminotransferase
MSDAVIRALLASRTPPALGELKPYVPDPTPGIHLDANEAPALLPTLSESERRVLHDTLAAIEPARYPDVRATALRQAICSKLAVSPDQLVIGVGSDEVIAMLIATVGRGPTSIAIPTPTFVMYRISARIHGLDVIEIPLDSDWDVDEARTIDVINTAHPAIVFLATPNNPTSGVYDLARVERIIEAAAAAQPPSIVVVDEAYLPFRLGSDDPWNGVTGIDLLKKHSNVVVLRTLSKIGLAAFRVGWAVAHPLLVAEMEKTRLPYNLPSPSQAVAVAALGPLEGAIERHVASINTERARFLKELSRIDGVRFGRTHANFVWLALPKPASDVVAALRSRGVLVRNFPAYPDRIRVSFGTPADDDRCLTALAEAVS